ncbi:MAG: methyltransferase domain-containing protein [Phycisphaerae bacterium]|nr:methyltransferase domain-containing protein [Phycisphaerae bacterium]
MVISIDSLYYVPNPKNVLLDMKNCLKPDGIFVALLTNRNLYAKLRAILTFKDDYGSIGDALVSYSLKGFKKLLSLAGFSIIRVIPDYGRGNNSFNARIHNYSEIELIVFSMEILPDG